MSRKSLRSPDSSAQPPPVPGLRAGSERARMAPLLIWAILPPLLLLGLLTAVLAWQIDRLLDATRWVEQTDQVMSLANRAHRLLIDQESGLRGHLITGDPEFLRPYLNAEAGIGSALAGLERLVADDRAQIERVRAMRPRLAAWRQFAHRILAARAAGQDYRTLVLSRVGKREMDRLRDLLDEFVHVEDKLHRQRVREVREGVEATLLSAGSAAVLLALVFGGVAARLLFRVSRTYQESLRELGESQELFRAFMDHTPGLAFVNDAAGRFLYVNRAFARVYETSLPEVQEKREKDLWPPDFAGRMRELDREVLERQRPVEAEETAPDAAGRARHWVVLKFPIGREGAEPLVGGMAMEVTDRKELEQQFRQSQKMEAVGRLAGGVAHDFNNMLAVINGYSELLLRRLPPEDPMRSPLEEVAKAGERAAGLTRQLLAFSRQQVLEPELLDLNERVLDIRNMLRRLIGEDIVVDIVTSPTPCRVLADPGQVEQVILNLSVNARDAMPQGGRLTLETRSVLLDEEYTGRHLSVKPGRYVVLSVSDTGCGMDEATQSRIFEPFFTTKEAGKGTGLGLPTVFGIVKQSGGDIWVYSEPGRGTSFKIYLPEATDREAGRPEAAAVRPANGTETILLVEDEPMVRRMAHAALAEHGYVVLEAQDGGDAVRLAREYAGPIHLLLTDVVMPGTSGRELAEVVTGLRPEARVLFMSGYTDDAVVRHGVLHAEVAFIQKPFSPAALVRKLQEVLSGEKNESGENPCPDRGHG